MPTNIGLTKRIFKNILGLSPKTIDKVIRAIQTSDDTTAIQTPNIRIRIGTNAFALVAKGLDAVKRVNDKQPDKQPDNQPDNQPDKQPDNQPDDKDDLKEGFSLKYYLINEAVIDTDDPDAVKKLRLLQQQTKGDPEKQARTDMVRARDEENSARDEQNPALKSAMQDVARAQKLLAIKTKKLAQLKQAANR
jgi:hypothetical protein